MKKKHIVVLVGSYYPNFSAVGICARNIVNELKREADITVISERTDLSEKEGEEHDGYYLIRTSTRLYAIKLYAINKRKTSPFKLLSLFWLMIINLIRVTFFLKAILQKVNIRQSQVDEYVKTLLRVNDEKEINAIICCSFPFESALAGVRYKILYHREVYVIPYLFDNFVERDSLHRTSWNKRNKWDEHINLVKTVLKESDRVFAMHTLQKHFQLHYAENMEKITYVEHPLLIKVEEKIRIRDERIKFIYAGSFLKGYVEPYLLIDVLKEILNRVLVDIDFYVMGNCTEYINELVVQFPQNVRNHGKVTFNMANNAMHNSDILLCVAEYSGIQMSSKIFTYMSVGAPIILFYYNENDVNKYVLSKYPLVLFIKQETKIEKEMIEGVIDFIETNKRKRLNFNEVRSLYSDAQPEYTALKILEMLR